MYNHELMQKRNTQGALTGVCFFWKKLNRIRILMRSSMMFE